jgi:lysophospholipase L1-like esterase
MCFVLCGVTAWGATPEHWVGTWGAAPMGDARTPSNFGMESTDGMTLRQVVHVSLGGSTIRVVLSNEFGTEPLTIGAAAIAQSADDGGIVAGSSVTLNFSGRPTVTIPPGALVVSDATPIEVKPLSNLSVSLFVPQQKIGTLTYHPGSYQVNYMAMGNELTLPALTNAKRFAHWYFLKDINVMAGARSAAVVTLGDSITDGTHSTPDANDRWPDVLAQRLAADKHTAKLGVLNEGIAGNRVLHDGYGPSALARFDRDVLAQDGVKYLIILEAINDIGHAYSNKDPHDVVTADDLIAGYVQMIERAHAHGIKVFGATLTPYVGAGYESAKGEEVREAVNQWIRTSGKFDGVIDFDKATRDLKNPEVYLPAYNSGDDLHPNDAGYKAMGDSIDLGMFTK